MAKRNAQSSELTAKQSASNLKKVSDRLIGSTQKLMQDIHAHLVELMTHAETYGDASPVGYFVNNLHMGARTASIQQWFERYSPVRPYKPQGWKKGDPVEYRLQSRDAKTFTEFNIPEASANPFYSEAETVKRPININMLLNQLANMPERIKTAVADERFVHSKDRKAEEAAMAKIISFAEEAKKLKGLDGLKPVETTEAQETAEQPAPKRSRSKKTAPNVEGAAANAA